MPEGINIIAILLSSVSGFMIGGLWYSPVLFQKPWMRHAGMTDEMVKGGNPAIIFGGAWLLSLLASVAFAFFMGTEFTWATGAAVGATAGIAWVAGSLGVNYLFERKPLPLFVINGGYFVVQYTIIGTIIGALQ